MTNPYILGSLASGFNKTSLISWWNLDEESGVRYDAHGTNHLTDNNTVLYAAGKVGNAAQFVQSNSEFLSIVDNPSISLGDIPFTFAIWLYIDSFPGYMRFITKDDNVGPETREVMFLTHFDDGNKFYWGRPNSTLVAATSFGNPSINTWYFVAGWHDPDLNKIYIQVNNGTVDSADHTIGFVDGTADLKIGGSPTENLTWSGRIESPLFAKRIYTADERTWLYNSEAGRQYSNL